ncbi:MAG: cytochrome P450, partial [Acidimicrobiaceae bacterium]|nr:cytochrome P450 [Acidimicrobiaceae bacterium]
MKPSDFPRDKKFRDPTTAPFQDETGMYHVMSHADVMRVLHNSDEAFSRDQEPYLAEGAPIHIAMEFMWMVEPFTLDGDTGRHDVLRGVVEPWFRNNAVRTMEPVIRRITVDTINEVVDKGTGEVDVAVEMSSRLAMRVICALIGLDMDREDWMRQQLDIFLTSPWDDMPQQWELQAYFWLMVARRLNDPKDELLDVLVGAWSDGTIGDRELLGYLFGFTAAGTDTTGASLANGFVYLAEFDLLDWARGRVGDDTAMRRAVEEILR